jgi:predicted GIY-YIG superfamily endonuclease
MTDYCLHLKTRTIPIEERAGFPLTIEVICDDCGQTKSYKQHTENNEKKQIHTAYVIGNAQSKAVYIGQTNNFDRRLNQHLIKSDNEHSHVECCDSAFFQRYEITDIIQIVPELTRSQATVKERELALHFRDLGFVVKGGK